jgi:hypothetical protein
MIHISSNRFELIPIKMEVSTAIIKDALAPYELKNLAAKVVMVAIFPFFMLALFEAIVINGTRIIINTCISILNAVYTCWFPNAILFPQNPTPMQPHTVQADPLAHIHVTPASSTDIEMPPPGITERKKVEFIVKTLALKDLLEIYNESDTLKKYGKEIAHIHPFQFLEAIFGKYSIVKEHMPTLMNKYIIPGEFLGGFTKSIKEHPTHSQMTDPYLFSFAKKMRTTPEKIQSFGMKLTEEAFWRQIVNHLMDINGLKVP